MKKIYVVLVVLLLSATSQATLIVNTLTKKQKGPDPVPSTKPNATVDKSSKETIPDDESIMPLLAAPSKKESGLVAVWVDKKRQKIEGFGACAWIGDPGSFSVLPELGMKWVRFNMENIRTFNQPDLPSQDYEKYFNRVAEWDRMRYLWAIKKRMGLKYMMVSFGAPPCWCDEKKTLKEEYIKDFAKLWAAGMKAYANKGFVPETIELFNEPDGHWDAYCSPENYNRVVKEVRRELDRAGLQKIQIVGPGRAHIDFGKSDPWVAALDKKALESIGAFSVHGWTYYGPESHSAQYVRDSIVGFLDSVNEKDPQQQKLRIMTEFSTKNTRFNGVKFGDHAKQFKDTAADTLPFAIEVTEDVLSHLNAGFNILLFWQMSDQWWEPASWGLLGRIGDGYPRKPIFYALKTLLPEITPGFRVVDVENVSGAYTAAFIHKDRLVIAMVNTTDQKQVQTVQLPGIKKAILSKSKCFDAEGTSEKLSHEPVSDEWITELPASSVTVVIFDIAN